MTTVKNPGNKTISPEKKIPNPLFLTPPSRKKSISSTQTHLRTIRTTTYNTNPKYPLDQNPTSSKEKDREAPNSSFTIASLPISSLTSLLNRAMERLPSRLQ
jgi:hypothetical protein